MPPATSQTTVSIIVGTMAMVAIIGVSALAFCAICKIDIEGALLTAFVGLTSAALSGCAAILSNTRTTPPDKPGDTSSSETVTKTQSSNE